MTYEREKTLVRLSFIDSEVKCAVEVTVVVDSPFSLSSLHCLNQGQQFIELVTVNSARSTTNGQRFEFGTYGEHFLDVIAIKSFDDRTLMGLEPQEPFGLESLDSLADWDV